MKVGDEDDLSLGTELDNSHSHSHLTTTQHSYDEDRGAKFLTAAEIGDESTLEALLSTNSDLVHFQDEDGYTALHRAAYSNAIPCLKFLLSHSSNVNGRTNDGWTPLHSAARWNAHEAVQILIESGADVNARSNGGQTPLHLAAESGTEGETLTLLLLHPSIDVSLLNGVGDKAYDIAARAGNFTYLFELTRDSINKF